MFAGYGLRRPRGRLTTTLRARPHRWDRGLHAGRPRVDRRTAALPRAIHRGTLEPAARRGRDRRRQHRESAHHGHPVERATLARLRPSMTLADSDLVETPGERISIRINPAHAAKLFAGSGHRFEDILAAADHESPLPRSARGPAAGAGEPHDRLSDLARRGRHHPRQRSEAARRVRGAVGAPRPPRHRRGDRGRLDLQRRDGQRLRRGEPDRDRAALSPLEDRAQAFDHPARGDRRGEGAPRLQVLRRAPAGAAPITSSPTSTWTCSFRSFPSAILTVFGLDESDLGDDRARWRPASASTCSATPSRNATGSSAAISTASSAREFPRWHSRSATPRIRRRRRPRSSGRAIGTTRRRTT